MKYRWNTAVNNLNFVLHEVKRLTKHLIRKKKGGRGRPPKHDPIKYVQTIVVKEFEKQSLRKAEVRITEFVVGERVDHSVISYWENKPEIANCLKVVVARAGQLLNKILSPLFSFVDATKFSSWKIKEIEFHVCNIVAQETVYPVGVSFLTNTVRDPVKEAVPEGDGQLLADAWYDDNKTMGVLFKKGYEPLICPKSMQIKILARIVCYQIKLLIRCDDKIISIDVLIIRHAPGEV